MPYTDQNTVYIRQSIKNPLGAKATFWDTLFFVYLCLDKKVVNPDINYRIQILFLKVRFRFFSRGSDFDPISLEGNILIVFFS